jgi:uncharacterized protein
MGRVFIILIAMLLADAAWWLLTDRLARGTAAPRRWRTVAAVAAGLPVLGLLLLILARVLHLRVMVMPEFAVILTYLWHFIVLPAALFPVAAAWSAHRGYRAVRPAAVDAGRRDFLCKSVIVLPPAAALAMAGQSRLTEDDLRLREIDVPLPGLPPELDGLTIAHVTDPHMGSFITDRKVRRIVEMTNDVDADLVLQTGDLINAALGDLPDGIAMCRQFRARYGVYHCQGNHDCIEDRDTFEADTVRAGLNMLLDEARVIEVRGRRVRLMGPRWWGYKEDVIAWSVRQLAPPRPDDAFNVLLAHHPHAFDTAAALGVPLTLAGHTHGGQLALSQNVGVGPLMYRYWSGLYRKGDSACVVSNGTGNWFPLRVNVPCEVLKLTLRRA